VTAGPPGGRVRTVFLGSGAFGRPALRRLAAHPSVELVGIVTAPPRPAGRQRRLTPTVIDEEGASLGIPVILRPERLRAPEAVADVLRLEPELLVLADYGQIVPAALLDVPHGALNLHPSLLPRHRGAVPIPAAILEGDAETGVTLMRMDAGLDTGPIVAQERIWLAGTEVTPDLEARLADVAAELLDRSLAPWLAGELPAVPQTSEGATLTRPMRREDGRLDPLRPAAELERRVRALQPWPGAFIELDGERVVVGVASTVPIASGDVPGTLVVEGRDPAIATSDGRLVLVTVTPAGRRAMPGADWLRGRRVRESR
jgi:methionyl-tRNA formyltransferase